MKNTDLKQICRYSVDPDALYGIVFAESEELILIAKEYDFFVDGFQVVRKKDISEIESTESTKYTYKLLHREGLLRDIECPIKDISGWRSVFSQLGEGEFVIVEDEVADDMLIGPITEVGPESVALRYFDGQGKWREESRIDYSDITSLQFRCNYVRVHQKYIGAV